ncbi:MAG: Gfo/Idh/MocA family protein [Verrucomicrobiales bacterium]
MKRRELISSMATLGTGLAIMPQAGAASSSSAAHLNVAVVGLKRGLAHVKALLALPNVSISHVAETDEGRLAHGLKVITKSQKTPCQGVSDFRTFLDDKKLDAVFIATPNFWHTPASLLCMAAGKHVYVEKPGSHNPREAEMIVESARKHERLCQMGNQRRSWPGIIEGIAKLHEGAIGKIHFGKAWYDASRKAIGKGDHQPSGKLDLNLWQGPVPEREDASDFVHYDWHWHSHYGNGELGNNAVHSLDVLRWGLGVAYPQKVSYLGGRYWFDDKQEFPDSGSAIYDFGHCGASWEQSSCHRSAADKNPFCAFYGEIGSMHVIGTKCVFYDLKGAVTSETTGAGGDLGHISNFLDAIRGKAKLNSEIAEGQISAMLCHLGNIAYRTSSLVQFDPEAKKIIDQPEADKLWRREYRKDWEPQV